MISDVPLGAFLSGGIDSSAIVSLMRQTHTGPIKTFSIVFDVPEFDERRYASAVAACNGTEHVELELTGAMARAHLESALAAFDQPSMDGLNTWFVSKLVKDAGLTVALSGVGGDELFVGYCGFAKPLAMARWQRRIGWMPASLGRGIASAARSERMRKFGQMMGYPLPAYFLSRQVFAPQQITSLLSPEFRSGRDRWGDAAFSTVLSDGTGRNASDQISIYELGTYMLSTLLRDTDQMSMAHSLEVRVPLIDPEVVSLLLRVPTRWKTDPTTPKPLLVRAAGAGLPPHCVHRPKRGFTLPFESWFKDAMRKDVESFCLGGACPIFDSQGLVTLWSQYETGAVAWSRIWSLFMLNGRIKKNYIESTL
jgi:asparagine synthase (glutamine-hydrolysing)